MRKHLYHCVIFQKVPKLSFEFFFGPHQHERVICVFRRRRFFFCKITNTFFPICFNLCVSSNKKKFEIYGFASDLFRLSSPNFLSQKNIQLNEFHYFNPRK